METKNKTYHRRHEWNTNPTDYIFHLLAWTSCSAETGLSSMQPRSGLIRLPCRPRPGSQGRKKLATVDNCEGLPILKTIG